MFSVSVTAILVSLSLLSVLELRAVTLLYIQGPSFLFVIMVCLYDVVVKLGS